MKDEASIEKCVQYSNVVINLIGKDFETRFVISNLSAKSHTYFHIIIIIVININIALKLGPFEDVTSPTQYYFGPCWPFHTLMSVGQKVLQCVKIFSIFYTMSKFLDVMARESNLEQNFNAFDPSPRIGFIWDAEKLCSSLSKLKGISEVSEYKIRLIQEINFYLGCCCRNFSFQEAHVDGAATIAKAAKKAGVKRFVHISAMNATTNSPSKFLQSKV